MTLLCHSFLNGSVLELRGTPVCDVISMILIAPEAFAHSVPRGPFLSPLTVYRPSTIATQIHRQDCNAYKHRAADNKPFWQVGIHNCIENAN